MIQIEIGTNLQTVCVVALVVYLIVQWWGFRAARSVLGRRS